MLTGTCTHSLVTSSPFSADMRDHYLLIGVHSPLKLVDGHVLIHASAMPQVDTNRDVARLPEPHCLPAERRLILWQAPLGRVLEVLDYGAFQLDASRVIEDFFRHVAHLSLSLRFLDLGAVFLDGGVDEACSLNMSTVPIHSSLFSISPRWFLTKMENLRRLCAFMKPDRALSLYFCWRCSWTFTLFSISPIIERQSTMGMATSRSIGRRKLSVDLLGLASLVKSPSIRNNGCGSGWSAKESLRTNASLDSSLVGRRRLCLGGAVLVSVLCHLLVASAVQRQTGGDGGRDVGGHEDVIPTENLAANIVALDWRAGGVSCTDGCSPPWRS